MQLVQGAEEVRRDRHRQHVRRHPVRRGGDADRLDRHAAVGLAGREQQGPVRAEPRQRARHRRQGHGQSAGYNPVRRHDASLLPQPARGRRPHRVGGAARAGRRACARRTSGREGTTQGRHARDGRRGRGRHHQKDDYQELAQLRFVSPLPRPATRAGRSKRFLQRKGKDMTMALVGLVGWRGMVGSVLMERMQAEGDFALIEPVFFSHLATPAARRRRMAKNETALQDAHDIER